MIDSFKGEYDFLSNFYMRPVKYGGVTYKSVEHAYQALKSIDDDEREAIMNAPTPGQAKKLGRKAQLRPDWESIKVGIMYGLLVKKFLEDDLAVKLLMTGDQELIEGNWWGDTFWGVCRGKGENTLGKLLTQVRDELKHLREKYGWPTLSN